MNYNRSRSLVYYFMDWVDGIPLYSYETVLQLGGDTENSADTIYCHSPCHNYQAVVCICL